MVVRDGRSMTITSTARQQIDQSLRWNSLLPDLQASTTLGQRTTSGVHCFLCRGVDHVTTQCALGFIQQPLTPQPSAGMTSSTMSTGGSHRPGQPRSQPICNSWNTGQCIYPGTCSFQHVCATCYQRHQARDCQQTGMESADYITTCTWTTSLYSHLIHHSSCLLEKKSF